MRWSSPSCRRLRFRAQHAHGAPNPVHKVSIWPHTESLNGAAYVESLYTVVGDQRLGVVGSAFGA